MTKPAIQLSLSLTDPNFSGLGRRKYTDKYTLVPVSAYPEDVKAVFQALYKVIGVELTDETASLSVYASPEGFPQRLVGPKVFQMEGKLGVKVKDTFYFFDKEVKEDEVVYTLKGKKLTLQADGKNPLFKLILGQGIALKLPIYMNANEKAAEGEPAYFGFADLESALASYYNEEQIALQVGSPSSGGSISFTALKFLPIGTYNVESAKNATGKFGATLNIVLSTLVEIGITVQEKDPVTEKWGLVQVTLPAESKLKIQGNTALKNSLMGAELTAKDKVQMVITGQENDKEGKIIVKAFFDFDNSPLKFEF